ncbi:hypothetical protein ACM41_16745 [Bradyrhizobium sp. CCBAU 21362]|nr:hypothetical protein [Bradyrhizobium sp. CCBAU 21362]
MRRLAEAIRYALSRWQELTRFIDDGRIELNNNVKLSRKNALFAGSDDGAEHWAVVASLVETCKLNDVAQLAYLTDVLTRSVTANQTTTLTGYWARPTALKAVSSETTLTVSLEPRLRDGKQVDCSTGGHPCVFSAARQMRHSKVGVQQSTCAASYP